MVDTGYNPRELADVILDQDLLPGYKVKLNRLIHLTVNAASPRPVALPDIADNCSLREARMRLEILGFRLTPIRRIRGDRDWVYAVEVRGREVRSGERLNVKIPLTLVVGDGAEDEEFNGNDSLDRLYFRATPHTRGRRVNTFSLSQEQSIARPPYLYIPFSPTI